MVVHVRLDRWRSHDLVTRRTVLRGLTATLAVGATVPWWGNGASAQEATPAAGTLLAEASFPAGTVSEGFVESWFTVWELGAGASGPYPAADLTKPPLTGAVLLLLVSGQLVITPAGGVPEEASPVRATPMADPLSLEAGEVAALAFDPTAAYFVENRGAEPARLVQAMAFNQFPTGSVPAPFAAIDWQGPGRSRVTAQTVTEIRLLQQRLEPRQVVPPPEGEIVQLVVSETPQAIGMRGDGSARNTSSETLDAYIAQFAYHSAATPTP